MKPEELQPYLIKLLKEKRPDITENERNGVVASIMKMCKTEEACKAFIKGMNS